MRAIFDMRDWHAAACAEMDRPAWQAHDLVEAHRLHDDIEATIGDDSPVHPASKRAVWDWLWELRDAACRGDFAEVRRLADMCKEQIAQEIAWHEEDLAAAWQVSRPPRRR